VALFRRGTQDTEPTQARRTASSRSAGSSPLVPRPAGKKRSSPVPPEPGRPVAPAGTSARTSAPKKDRPTPSRKEAEAARRQRVNRTLTQKEARRLNSQQSREQRMRSTNAREATPEKALLRDYVDTRRNLGEFLLPSLVVILAASFLSALDQRISAITTLAMYLFILAVLADSALMWRGFKRVLAERLPGASTRGLMMYGINRAIQIRRFRMPPPRLKRGDTY
jgi:hypothetical protein